MKQTTKILYEQQQNQEQQSKRNCFSITDLLQNTNLVSKKSALDSLNFSTESKTQIDEVLLNSETLRLNKRNNNNLQQLPFPLVLPNMLRLFQKQNQGYLNNILIQTQALQSNEESVNLEELYSLGNKYLKEYNNNANSNIVDTIDGDEKIKNESFKSIELMENKNNVEQENNQEEQHQTDNRILTPLSENSVCSAESMPSLQQLTSSILSLKNDTMASYSVENNQKISAILLPSSSNQTTLQKQKYQQQQQIQQQQQKWYNSQVNITTQQLEMATIAAAAANIARPSQQPYSFPTLPFQNGLLKLFI